MSRKLLAAAPLAFALAACHPPARVTTVAVPAPVTAPASEQVAVPQTAPDAPHPPAAATPMCDRSGRPLPGNVRTKTAVVCP